MDSQVNLDKIDTIVLKSLIKDARTNFSDIAQKCGISTNSIVKRFNKMKKSGIINGTTLLIDLSESHSEFAIAIIINSILKWERQIIEQIRMIPNIIECYPAIGNHNIYATAFTKNIEEIGKLKETLKKIKGIRKIGITANLDRNFFFPENLIH